MKHMLFIFLSFISTKSQAESIPMFDAHLHYSHDAVIQVPPAEAAALLRKAGLKKALISSSDDVGTQKIFKAAPEIVVPALGEFHAYGVDIETPVLQRFT